jgi:tRNA (guanine-N7-)-methyltransferase
MICGPEEFPEPMILDPGQHSKPSDEPTTEPAAGASPAVTHPRTIRSFVVRNGRMTVAQQRAWQTLWPRYGRELDRDEIDLDAWFGRRAPRTLEIGFGNGENLLELAERLTERDFLGIEVHRPGIGHLLLGCERRALTNVRVICGDALECLAAQLPGESFAEVLLYFPDPWPKSRHHKRRIVQPAFVEAAARVLQRDGVLRLATDWEPYAEHMRAVLAASDRFVNDHPEVEWAPRPASRPQTRFERRGRRLGHTVRDLAYRRR